MLAMWKRLLFDSFPAWDDPDQCRFQRVEIDADACDGCRMCVIVCPARVLELHGQPGQRKARTIADVRGCISCNNCMAICENDAIRSIAHFELGGFYESRGIGAFAPPRVSMDAGPGTGAPRR